MQVLHCKRAQLAVGAEFFKKFKDSHASAGIIARRSLPVSERVVFMSLHRFAPLFLVIAASMAPAPLAARSGAAADIAPFDVHLDIPEDFDARQADHHITGQFDLALATKGGLKGAGLAVFAPQQAISPEALAKARALAERKHGIITGIAAAFPARAALAHSPAEWRRIVASGRLAIVETVVNGGAFVNSVDDVDLWARRGVQVFGFVHAGHNDLADSSRPSLARGETISRNDGLSPLGKAVLARLNRDGILVDVSQLSDKAFDDVLRLSTAPVIASHSDVRALVDVTRNLTDAQLDAIKAKGGVVAVNAFAAYLHPRAPGSTDKPKATLDDLIAALDYVVKRIGVDHVALSSDFNHGGGITGWQDEGETGQVTQALLAHGYSRVDVAKIWSGNVLRVWAAAQAQGHRPGR